MRGVIILNIQENEKLLQELLNISNDIILILDQDQTIINYNEKFAKIIGYDKNKSAIGLNWFNNFLPKSERDDVRDAFNDLIQKKIDKVEFFKNHIKSINNQEILVKWHNKYLENKNGDISAILSVGNIISEKYPNEETLKNLKLEYNQLKLLLDSLPSIIYIIDIDTYEIVFANKTLTDSYNDSLLGKTCYKILQGKKQPCEFCTNKILLENPDEPYIWEYYNPLLKKYFLIYDQLLKWVDGRVVRFESALDITERKMFELEKQLLIEKLERSNKELEQFAYIASHDLQEPLRTVTSFLQLIERRYSPKLDDDGKQFIHYATDASNRMKKLIQDLLKLSRITTRGQDFIKTDLNQIINDIKEDFKIDLQESKTELIIEDLPEICCDPTQIKSLFQNLISNAIKFRRREKPLITIRSQEKNGKYLFEVEDNGIGIEKIYYDKAFQIFQRLNAREKYKGTGIGLALCKKIVQRHDGRIWIESQINKGTKFFIEIPKNIKKK